MIGEHWLSVSLPTSGRAPLTLQSNKVVIVTVMIQFNTV